MRPAAALLCLLAPSVIHAADSPKTILLIAGTKSHGPGEHEYEKGARLLAHCINTSPNVIVNTGPFNEYPWLYPGYPVFGIGGWAVR